MNDHYSSSSDYFSFKLYLFLAFLSSACLSYIALLLTFSTYSFQFIDFSSPVKFYFLSTSVLLLKKKNIKKKIKLFWEC